MEQILVFGGNGYIGTHVRALFPEAVSPKGDISDRDFVIKALDETKPTVVINTAGKTGRPNVDWCEDHKEETLRANVIGPLILLEECMKRNIYFVHVGSGCIYGGESPEGGFTEENAPNFYGSFYSLTKYTSDLLLQRFPILNLRLRMPFDGTTNERNLIMKLKKYKKVLDEPNSLTYLPDFLRALKVLVEKKTTGTFNIVNPGALSPYHVMQEYQRIVDPTHTFERLTLQDLGSVVKAERSNCVLSAKKLQDAGITLQSAEDALAEALHAMKI